MADTAAQYITELAEKLEEAKTRNRLLLCDLTDYKIENAKLRMKVARLEAELQKIGGQTDD